MVTVLRDPRMWAAAALATIVSTVGWTFILAMFARDVRPKEPPPTAAPVQLPLIRHGEEPEQPIPAVVLAGGFAVVLFGAAGVASWIVLGRGARDDDDPTTPT